MPLHAVVLDERTLQRGSEAQREDWAASIRELLSTATCNIDAPATLYVEHAERHFSLRFEVGGKNVSTFVLDHELLAEQITEYLDIVRQITHADGLNQMEALDMAKKVTHDRAGRVLKRELREVGFDLDTSRRLFTLLLSLKIDTTRLPGIRAHPKAH